MTKVVFENEYMKVVELYVRGELFSTSTYFYDSEGYVIKLVRRMANGNVF